MKPKHFPTRAKPHVVRNPYSDHDETRDRQAVDLLYTHLVEIKESIRNRMPDGEARDFLLSAMQEILDKLAARLLEA